MILELHDSSPGNSLQSRIVNIKTDPEATSHMWRSAQDPQNSEIVKWVLKDDIGVRCVWKRKPGSIELPIISRCAKRCGHDAFKGSAEPTLPKTKESSYNVAFVNTAATGGFEGVITWSSFKSKEDFDKWFTDELKLAYRVVEEGISTERCVELTRQTPLESYVASAFDKSRSPGTGKINREILNMELGNVLIAERLRRHGRL